MNMIGATSQARPASASLHPNRWTGRVGQHVRRNTLHTTAFAVKPGAPVSLFERIGTALDVEPQVAVDAVAGYFVDALLEDDRVSHFFTSRGTDRDSHVKHLEQFIAVAFGKPGAAYNFSEEGVTNLTKAHADMGIQAEHFEIVASHLQGCMEKAEVPAELVQEGIAVVNSTKDDVLGDAAVVA